MQTIFRLKQEKQTQRRVSRHSRCNLHVDNEPRLPLNPYQNPVTTLERLKMETGGRSENISLAHTKSLIQGLLEVYLDVYLLSIQTTDCNKERRKSIGTGIENHAVKTLSHSFCCGAPRRELKSSRNYKRSVSPQTSNNILQYSLNRAHRNLQDPPATQPTLFSFFLGQKNLDLSIQKLLWFVLVQPVQTHHGSLLIADYCVCDKKSHQQNVWTMDHVETLYVLSISVTFSRFLLSS